MQMEGNLGTTKLTTVQVRAGVALASGAGGDMIQR
jgi:hypothetical protein